MSSTRRSIPSRPKAGESIVRGKAVRLGVGLGPFYASTRVGGRRRRGRQTNGNAGCLTGLLTLFFLPFFLIAKLYQWAWRKPQTQRGKVLSVSGVSVGLLVLLIIGAVAGGGSKTPTPITPSPVASAVPVVTQVSTTPSATHKAAASKSPTPVATSAAASSSSPAPVHTQVPATTAPPPAAPTTAPAAPPAPDTQAPPPAAPKAGQFCPDDEHGLTVDGLTCSYYPSSGTWHWKH
jgi:hypothetical protein